MDSVDTQVSVHNTDRSPIRVSFSSRADIESSGWMRMTQDCVSCIRKKCVSTTSLVRAVSHTANLLLDRARSARRRRSFDGLRSAVLPFDQCTDRETGSGPTNRRGELGPGGVSMRTKELWQAAKLFCVLVAFLSARTEIYPGERRLS
jgi:hypothetical protein